MAEKVRELSGKIKNELSGIKLPYLSSGQTVYCGVALIVILALAVALRVLPIRYGAFFTAYDPLFQFRATRYIVENGFESWFSWHDMLSWYPMGRDIPRSAYMGVPFSGALVYHLVRFLGIRASVHDVCLFFPVLMSCLACLAMFFLAKDLGGRAAGLFAALFLAISPAFIGRTHMGFYDTENIGIFGMILTSLLFLRSIEDEKTLSYRLLYAVSAGLSLGYLFISWGAARYAVGLLALFILASLFLGSYRIEYLTSYCLTLGVGLGIAMLAPKPGVLYPMSMENLAALGLVFVQLIYWFILSKEGVAAAKLAMIGMFGLGIIGIFLLPMLGIGIPIGGKFLNVLNPFRETNNPLFESVAEHKVASWTTFFRDFGMTIFLGLLGSYFVIKDLKGKKLYGLTFFLTGLYFAGGMSRLMLILSIPMALMGAYGLVEVIKPLKDVITGREKSESSSRKRRKMGVSRGMATIFVLLLLMSIVPQVYLAASSANQPNALASSSIPIRLGGEFPEDWLQALNWMNDNLDEDSVVVSWWDYGYWIEALANKTTLADGATMDQHQIANIAKIMMNKPNNSLPILKKYNATHIVVFVTYNPGNPQQSWPFGDNVKWQWMVRIGGFNETDFVSQNPSTGQTQYTDRFRNSTIFNLMYGQRLENFSPVFISKYGFVKIYRVDY